LEKELVMPTRNQAPIGHPCWIDLLTSDPDASRAFYGGLLGWTSEDAGPDYGGYINFAKDNQAVGGAMANDPSFGAPDHWTVYLAVADAQATADAVAAHGGQILMPVTDVMTLGRMAVVSDPTGAAVGIWQALDFQGFGVLAEPGTAAWFELRTKDYDAAVDFYREVFGWDVHTMSDDAEFRYSTLGDGAEAAAGIMDAAGFLPGEVPSHWAIYFAFDDSDAALAKAIELGGAEVRGLEDTPYGRMGEAADPTGVHFNLLTPPSA
jgi:uncharacterized protein